MKIGISLSTRENRFFTAADDQTPMVIGVMIGDFTADQGRITNGKRKKGQSTKV